MPTPKIKVIWNENYSYKFTIIVIQDPRQNLQWDAIQTECSFVIIPNTEKPIQTEKDKT